MSYASDSDKLGPVEDHPPNSYFKKWLKRRMPGWHADTQGLAVLFPEEALELKVIGAKVEFEPFEAFFDEPASGNPNPKWLGAKLPTAASDFNTYLHAIANHIRRYNAALYWMRRLHFLENETTGNVPAHNPHGDKDQNPTPNPENVEAACLEWELRVKELNKILNNLGATTYGFNSTKADMIEVNGYIISMRIVSTPAIVTAQIGGSSSSYVYISSPYSSSAPPPPPPPLVEPTPGETGAGSAAQAAQQTKKGQGK